MRRFLVVLLVLVAVSPVAAADAVKSPSRVSVSGKISALRLTSVTVRGSRKLTCKVRAVSPRALGYVLGSGARITCTNGVLTKIVGTDPPVPVITGQATTTKTSSTGSGNAGAVDLITTQTSTSSSGVTSSSSSVSGTFTLSALTPTSITVSGFSGPLLTCSLGTGSPDLTGFQISDRLSRLTCSNGILTAITRAT